MLAEHKIAVALDNLHDYAPEKLLKDLSQLPRPPKWIKIGMEAFFASGEAIISQARAHGFSIFLDLKLHDIPNTLCRSIDVLIERYQPELLNMHAASGVAAMREVAKTVQAKNAATRVIAVTVLTSLDENDLQALWPTSQSPQSMAMHFATLAKAASLDGVVCSGQEVKEIKANCGPDFLCITPGIRFSRGANDQKRVCTPHQALKNGSDLLVVGRELTRSVNLAQTYQEMLNALAGEEPHVD